MKVAVFLVRAIAATLPGPARERYRQEWQADVFRAGGAGVSPWPVVAGAVATAAALDRTSPTATGMARRELVAVRAAWAGASLGGAVILALGLPFWGGYRGSAAADPVAAAVIGVLAVAFKAGIVALGLLGVVALAGTAVAAFAVHGRRVLRWAGWGTLVLCGSVAVWPPSP